MYVEKRGEREVQARNEMPLKKAEEISSNEKKKNHSFHFRFCNVEANF